MDDLTGTHAETTVTDLAARRPEVLRRLLDLGVPAETLETILPDWSTALAAALSAPAPTA